MAPPRRATPTTAPSYHSRFREVVWTGGICVAALSFYMVSMTVAATRKQVRDTDTRIQEVRREIVFLRRIIARGTASATIRPSIACTFGLTNTGTLTSLEVDVSWLPSDSRMSFIAVPARLNFPQEPDSRLIGILKTADHDRIILRGKAPFQKNFEVLPTAYTAKFLAQSQSDDNFTNVFVPRTPEFLQRYAAAPDEYSCSQIFLSVPAGYKEVRNGQMIEFMRPTNRALTIDRSGTANIILVNSNDSLKNFLGGAGFNFITLLIGVIVNFIQSAFNRKAQFSIATIYSIALIIFMAMGLYATLTDRFSLTDGAVNFGVGVTGLAVVWLSFLRGKKPSPK